MIYDTNYGATFGNANAGDTVSFHSMRDFGLYPRSKPVIAPPKPKTQTIDIPGADGVLDFTQALTGDVYYENRPGTFPYVFIGDRRQWDGVLHRVLAAVHGKRMAVILDEDPGGYYYGRFTVDAPEYDQKGRKAFLTITADLEPWFYDPYSTIQPWVWDTFNFETGVARDYSAIVVNTTGGSPITYTLVGGARPVCPVFRLTSGTIISVTYTSVNGTSETHGIVSGADYQFDDFILRDGETVITLAGNGTLQIEYRGGVL